MSTSSQTTTFLRGVLLTDPDGNKSKIINVRGAEVGLDHLEITTQSREQKEAGTKSIRRLYCEEVQA